MLSTVASVNLVSTIVGFSLLSFSLARILGNYGFNRVDTNEEKQEFLDSLLSAGRLIGWPLSLYIFGIYLGIPRLLRDLITVTLPGFFGPILVLVIFWLPVVLFIFVLDFISYLGVSQYYKRINAESLDPLTNWVNRSKALSMVISFTFFSVIISTTSLFMITEIEKVGIHLAILTIWMALLALGSDFVQPYFRRTFFLIRTPKEKSTSEIEEFFDQSKISFSNIWIQDSRNPEISISWFTKGNRQLVISNPLISQFTAEERGAMIAQKLYLAKRHWNVYTFLSWVIIGELYILSAFEMMLATIRLNGAFIPEILTLILAVANLRYGYHQMYAAADYAVKQSSRETVREALIKAVEIEREQTKKSKIEPFIARLRKLMEITVAMGPPLQWRLDRLQE